MCLKTFPIFIVSFRPLRVRELRGAMEILAVQLNDAAPATFNSASRPGGAEERMFVRF